MYKAIIVGAGRLGRIHGINLKNTGMVEIVGVVNPSKEKGMKLASELGAIYFNDFQSSLKAMKPDMVIIASPMNTHANLIIESAENGIHVFTEKPMGINSNENSKIVSSVQKNKIKLQIGFQRLYDDSFINAKRLLDSNAIGRPLIAELISRDPTPEFLPYLPYPGAIYDDFVIHDFATLVSFFGFKRMTVYSTALAFSFPQYKEAGDYDNTLVNVKYYDGPLVNIDTSRCSKYGYDIRLEVLGENGLLKVENVTDYQTFVYKGDSVTHPPYLWFEDRFRDAYRREIEAFVKAVMNDERTFPDEVFGMQVGRISDAAKKSALEGVPVTVE
ncbi:Gfo/Idh/MocA family oxidoreductase [Metallosphaera javensis (ex Sakai et al. 2022)]|uniref:Gfo/Idh/MocA family oxidoreductase n=1 Tax=Metallosphaera javensis (ex Sakai et al. 2022) TaxID=2775498 RepID=UPI003CE4FC97